MSLTTQESTQLIEKADAVGNSYAAGEGAAKVSDRIEDLKSFARSLAPIDEPTSQTSDTTSEPEVAAQDELEPQHESFQ